MIGSRRWKKKNSQHFPWRSVTPCSGFDAEHNLWTRIYISVDVEEWASRGVDDRNSTVRYGKVRYSSV